MKVETNEQGDIVLKEIYCGVILETSEGNQLGICMRDDTFEMNVMPKGEDKKNWWRVAMDHDSIIRGLSPPPTPVSIPPSLSYFLNTEGVRNILTPDWKAGSRVSNWRNHVPHKIRECWPHLDEVTKTYLAYMAQLHADNEDWE